jgi:hypothetical protein
MADHIRNFITVFGNSEVRSLVPEICRRLELNPDIGVVLYGKSIDNSQEFLKKTGSYFVEPSYDFGYWGDEITLVSGRRVPHQLIAHITWFLSKIDPNVVVCDRYDHDEGEFVGTTFRIVEKGKIRFFDEIVHIDLPVLYEQEVQRYLAENNDESETDILTWEQVWEIKSKTTEIALGQLVKEFPNCRKYVNP